jgi:hypothetical protein
MDITLSLEGPSQQEKEKHAEHNNSRAFAPFHYLQRCKTYLKNVLNIKSVVNCRLQFLFQKCFAPINI